jgi:hypothetical protein
MASKAHVFHDYSFGSAHSRPRQLWYRREDPVELPRNSIWRAGGGALVTVAAMGALVLGSAYAASRETPPPMAETPALPPLENWQPDPTVIQARVMNVLQGPALSVPEKAAPFMDAETAGDVPATSASSESPSFESRAPESRAPESRAPESREVIIDDSKMYPPTPTPAPYPNPTTTPPDAIAPPEAAPASPAPAPVPGLDPAPSAHVPGLDPENPYQD